MQDFFKLFYKIIIIFLRLLSDTYIIYTHAHETTHTDSNRPDAKSTRCSPVLFQIIIIFCFLISITRLLSVPAPTVEISPPASFQSHHSALHQPIAPSASAAPHPESGWATSLYCIRDSPYHRRAICSVCYKSSS